MSTHAPLVPPTPVPPIDTLPLMPGLQAELIALLRGLAPEDWERQTMAPAWRVKDVATHLLDTCLRRLSASRDGYRRPPDTPLDSYGDLVRYLNRLNDDWVRATARLSPRVITDLLAIAQPQAIELFASLDPEAPAPIAVAWAGQDSSPNWFDIGREYTEWWHHQAQIRDAVGAPPLEGREWLHPFLELSLLGLPHAYRGLDAPTGTSIVLTIQGEAGDVWTLRRKPATPAVHGWELLRGAAPAPQARLRIQASAAWRLLFNALPGPEARRVLHVEGDARLAEPLLAARSVMV